MQTEIVEKRLVSIQELAKQDSVGFGDTSDFTESFPAYTLSDLSQGDTLWIGQAQPGGQLVRRMRFSAARYSFCKRSSWFTEPVT